MEFSLLVAARERMQVGKDRDATYFWISETEVLWLQHATWHDQPTQRIPIHALRARREPGHYEAVLLNTVTRSKEPLTVFNARYASLLTASFLTVNSDDGLEATLHSLPPDCALSPDGQRLLWRGANLNGRPGWTAATLDGSRQWVWADANEDASGPLLWQPDGCHWVELVRTDRFGRSLPTQAKVRSLDDPQMLQCIRITGVQDGLALGMTRDPFLLLYDPGDSYALRSLVRFWTVGLNASVAFTREYAITLPEPARIAELALSREGDSLAWLLCGEKPDTYALWISDVRGRQFRKGGTLRSNLSKTPGAVDALQYDWPHALRWTPGGRVVSFLLQGTLYTYDVEWAE